MGTKGPILYLLVICVLVQADVEKLQCPSGISRFSSRTSPNHFYQCTDGIPVLKECPDGKRYHMQKQKCLSAEETPKNQAIVEKNMGRGLDLGSLYDAKDSTVYNDASLWSQNTINQNKFRYDRKEVNTAFTADKSIHDKTSHFDISARLSMDFMGGMVSVSGGMEYLKDEVSSEREVNVEMLYHTTKYTETLPKKTKKDHEEECKNINDPYTHVVTSVTYGLDCNFVFKYFLEEHESESKIAGDLEIAINNIPSFSISGKGEVDLSESEQNMMEKTQLVMYGDMSLDADSPPLPTDFDTACNFFKALPHMANKHVEVLEVHMTPIEDICDATDNLLNEISDSMMAEVINMMDELNQLEIKSKGLLITPEAIKFFALRENLNIYYKGLTNFINDKKAQLQDLLPKIRGDDDAAEEDLISVLHNFTNSPFEFETSDGFLIDRNREISAVSFLLSSFPDEAENIVVVDYKQASDVNIFLKYEYVTVLEFKILTPPSLTENFLESNPQSEENFWYNSIAVNGHVGSLLRNFSEFALENAGKEGETNYGYMINCLVIEEGEDIPTTMKALDYGSPVFDNEFVVPSAPLQPYIHYISFDKFSFSVPRFNEFTTGLKVTVTDVYADSSFEETFPWSTQEEGPFEIEIISSNINPATVYSVVAQYTTMFGLGPKSMSSRLFITAPSSCPNDLIISDVTTSSFRVSWSKPANIGNGILEEDLIYSIEITGDDGYVEKKTTNSEFEFIFENLVDATKYNIEAKAFLQQEEPVFQNESISSLSFVSVSQPATVTQTSSPFAPKMIPSMPGEVTASSATLRWESPAHLPEYENLNYKLEYWPVEFEEEKVEELLGDINLYELTNLEINTMYAARVKVITELGESQFSGVLNVKTLDDKSDVGHFVDEVKENLDDIIKEMKRRSSFCASISETNLNGVLVYNKLFLDQSNVPGALLDPSTGKFTAGAAGSYQVLVSAEVITAPDQTHDIWVAVNDVKIEESKIHSVTEDYMFDAGYDNASRDIVLKLQAGETVSIIHETNGEKQLKNVIFCVSSFKLDSVNV